MGALLASGPVDSAEHGNAATKLLASSIEIRVRHSFLRGRAIPKAFVGKTFGDLFLELLSRSVLTLSLYRSREAVSAASGRCNDVSYIYTCPRASTALESSDYMYCLVPEEMETQWKAAAQFDELP